MEMQIDASAEVVDGECTTGVGAPTVEMEEAAPFHDLEDLQDMGITAVWSHEKKKLPACLPVCVGSN